MNNLKIKTEKGLVKKIRAIRDRMNLEMQDMTFEEMKAYLQMMRESSSPKQKL